MLSASLNSTSWAWSRMSIGGRLQPSTTVSDGDWPYFCHTSWATCFRSCSGLASCDLATAGSGFTSGRVISGGTSTAGGSIPLDRGAFWGGRAIPGRCAGRYSSLIGRGGGALAGWPIQENKPFTSRQIKWGATRIMPSTTRPTRRRMPPAWSSPMMSWPNWPPRSKKARMPHTTKTKAAVPSQRFQRCSLQRRESSASCCRQIKANMARTTSIIRASPQPKKPTVPWPISSSQEVMASCCQKRTTTIAVVSVRRHSQRKDPPEEGFSRCRLTTLLFFRLAFLNLILSFLLAIRP